MPMDYTFNDVKSHIAKSLPAVDSPGLFGMASDAEMTYMENQAQTIISTVINIQPSLSIRLATG